MTKSLVISQFLLSVILGKNGVRQKFGKLRKGSACLEPLFYVNAEVHVGEPTRVIAPCG